MDCFLQEKAEIDEHLNNKQYRYKETRKIDKLYWKFCSNVGLWYSSNYRSLWRFGVSRLELLLEQY